MKFSLGIDFGSNSVRSLLVNLRNGEEVASAVADYQRGEKGVLEDRSDPHLARQSPADFLISLERSVKETVALAISQGGFSVEDVIGIGVDTTGSTPIPVTADMAPLADLDAFKDNLNAQAWMWKDHTSMEEAAKITEAAAAERPRYLKKCGGVYSSEWFFAKIWHCLNVDPAVFDAAHTWIEFADFIPAVMAGITRPAEVKPGVCAAGHKAMYCEEWGGLPDAEFLSGLDPKLGELRARLYDKAYASDTVAGHLCEAWSAKLGLPSGIPIAVGAFDAHLGAVGAGIGTGKLVKIIGTSTCDIMVAEPGEKLPDVPGVCGVVDGSVLPGRQAIEAGQSAVGDIFNWFATDVCQRDHDVFTELTAEAERLRPGESGLLSLDWNNGNRTILVDPKLTGLTLGTTLHTSRAEMYRALIEGTAFGARKIIDRVEEYGVKVEEVINCGGIAEKNAMFMQIYADVLGRSMKLSSSSQTCALGSAIMGAVAAGPENGGFASVEDAQKTICSFKDVVYEPNAERQAVYEKLYRLYGELHDSFGVEGTSFDHHGVMKELLTISAHAKKTTS